ncbi:hypothetical protein ScPMuIL_001638 [Solemya velum]
MPCSFSGLAMDSPLNLAHQQSRKADLMLKAGRFQEATSCHQRAAEHLLEALHTSTCRQATDSLRLQHQYHLKQTSWIQERERRAERIYEQKTQKRENSISQGTQTEMSIPAEFDSQPLGPTESRSSLDSHSSPDPMDGSHDKHSISQAMTEADSLLVFLNRRKPAGVEQVAACVSSSGSTSNAATSNFPKDDKI